MDDVRQAVGVFAFDQDQWLMIKKIKRMDTEGEGEGIEERWDIVKGGVEPDDETLCHAAIRELGEETGSGKFEIRKAFDDSITFSYPDDVAEDMGYDGQKTHMFLARFTGARDDLVADGEEVGAVRFLDRDEFMSKIPFDDVKAFFNDNVA